MKNLTHIAIDGPVGSGKSTIAKLVAKELGFTYIDTGAMYRAVALHCLNTGADVNNESEVTKALSSASINIKYNDGTQHIFLNEKDVSQDIRSLEVAQSTSKVSIINPVREHLVQMQQNMAKDQNIVMDGRDIGTVVLPNANVKVFLTASVDIRAARRQKDLLEKGEDVDINKIKQEIEERDERDTNRQISPLKQADDAKLIDTSHMSLQQVVNAIVELCAGD